VKEISVEELARWRASGKAFTLLDVRTAAELALASIPGATHVPMAELAARLSDLDPSCEIAVLCHSGNRSAFVTEFLTRSGFSAVYNVAGGIAAYAARVDPSVGRY
jgi:rhodanese-related sulfurtransferase